MLQTEHGGIVQRLLGPHARPAQLLVILVLAFAIRLLLNLQFQGLGSGPDPDVGPDALAYNRLGESLAAGLGYTLEVEPDLHYPPGVPALLAFVYAPAGPNYAAARVWFSLLGALACVATALFGFRVGGQAAGLIAGTGLAMYPEHAYWSMHFDPEVPLGLVLIALALTHLALLQRWTTPRGLGFGALLGAAALLSPRSLFLALAYVALLAVVTIVRPAPVKALRQLVPRVILLTAGALLVVAPWTVRNFRVSGDLVLISSHGGDTLLHGNNRLVFDNPEWRGSWYRGPLRDIPGYAAAAALPEGERSAAFSQLAGDFIRSLTPGQVIDLEMRKLWHFATPWLETPNAPYRLAVAVAWTALLPFVVAGIIFSLRDRRALLLHAVLLSYLAITLIFFGEPRYRATISPVLMAYTAWVFARWSSAFGRFGVSGGSPQAPGLSS